MSNEQKILELATLKVSPEEFKKFVTDGKAEFDFEYLAVDWIDEEEIKSIGKCLKEIAEIYKAALIRKYEKVGD